MNYKQLTSISGEMPSVLLQTTSHDTHNVLNVTAILWKKTHKNGGADSDKSECNQTREMRQYGTRSNRKR
jgi:hypothetical protein